MADEHVCEILAQTRDELLHVGHDLIPVHLPLKGSVDVRANTQFVGVRLDDGVKIKISNGNVNEYK